MGFRVPVQGLCGRGAMLGVLLVTACGSDTPSDSAGGGSVAPAPVTAAGNSAGGSNAPSNSTAGSTAANSSGGKSGGTAPMMTAGGVAVQPTGGVSGGGAGSDSPPPAATTDWAMMGYDHGSTYFNRGETKLTKENAATLKEAWMVNMGGNVYGAPLQVGDKIYASGPTTVRAFDAASGMQLWSVMVGSTGSMSFADGTLYLNNTSGIHALSATDGHELWSKPINPSVGSDGTSSPLAVGDLVLAGGSNGAIELIGGNFRGFMGALDRMTGASKWVTYTVPETAKGASMWSSPAADLAAGRAYGATGNNYGAPATDSSDSFIAFDLMTGAIIWKSQRVMNDTFGGGGLGNGPDADFGASPVLYETLVGGVMTKVIAAGNKGGEAHAVRAEDGMMLWERDLGPGAADGSSGIFTNSAWTGKYMLFACNGGSTATLFALDGATGEMAWMRPLPGLVWGRTAVANGVGFVGTGTKLEVFDVDTGDVLKSFDSKGGSVAGTITVANGRVAFGEGLTWSSGVRGQTLTVLSLP